MTTGAQMIKAMAESAAALANRDSVVFGAYLDDVRLLRRREFTITREGAAFCVDGREVDGATLRALADRERRLMDGSIEVAAPIDSDRQIGETEALERPPRRCRPEAMPRVERQEATPSAPRKRRARTACGCGGCIPASDVLAIVADLKRLTELLARRGS